MLAGVCAIGLVSCGGGTDRSAAARQTVQNYWGDISHGKMSQAYNMQTTGARQTTTLANYSRNLFDFLQGTAGVRAVVGSATLNGDQAAVAVTLKSPKAPNPKSDLHAYQHLFWENGQWRISDQNGGLSHTKGV